MSVRAGDAFPQFLRTFVSPVLKARGYKQAGRTYQRTQGPVTARLIFMRYTGAPDADLDRLRIVTQWRRPVSRRRASLLVTPLRAQERFVPTRSRRCRTATS